MKRKEETVVVLLRDNPTFQHEAKIDLEAWGYEDGGEPAWFYPSETSTEINGRKYTIERILGKYRLYITK